VKGHPWVIIALSKTSGFAGYWCGIKGNYLMSSDKIKFWQRKKDATQKCRELNALSSQSREKFIVLRYWPPTATVKP